VVDKYDNDGEKPVKPSNIKKKPKSSVAVAIEGTGKTGEDGQKLPHVAAAGRGKIAEQILQIAFDSGIKVREDSALAEMLAAIELDSPIPHESFAAVAEILSYVYRANGEPNPFDAVLEDAMQEQVEKENHDHGREDQ
jgi:flagellar biosynthesis protein